MMRPRQYGQMGLSYLKALALSFALLCTATAASASNCPIISGTRIGPGAGYWLDVDSTCLTSDGSPSTTTLSCGSIPGYSFTNYGRSNTEWSFVVPQFPWYSHWGVTVWVDFDSPTHTIYDALYGTISVIHNDPSGPTYTTYSIFHLQGNSATSNLCVRYDKTISGAVAPGDTIIVKFNGYSAFDGGTIQASIPKVWNSQY